MYAIRLRSSVYPCRERFGVRTSWHSVVASGLQSGSAGPALVWGRRMWGLLLDKVLPEYDLAKARSVLKVFATTKSMARSNDMDCQKGSRFGRDDQVAKQVHIVV